ncbi:protein Star-like [Eriocheir sinensis]|uniref:protein Star-like n=1 Tax=Eriocheir sinensis TaxID=95602 RepID=UPI0021C8AF76|nr:protein Star-like [Eriocheir sinensis]
MEEEDPKLVRFVKRRLQPPSILPYNLTNPNKIHYSQYGQSKLLDEKFIHGMVGGVFVEAGALDGEHLSNTLYLEKHLGWSGILVEPMPSSYELLRKKNRHAYILNAALSTTKNASQIIIRWKGEHGGASQMIKREGRMNRKMKGNDGKKDVKVISVPFFSIFLALNVTQIDFLSLDLEGAELQVLKTVPWEKVRVRVMCVECNKVRPPALISYLTSVGYRHLGNYGIDCWFGWPSLLDETLSNTKSKKSQ